MNAKQTNEFQKDFEKAGLKAELGSYIFMGLAEDEGDLAGVFFGNIEGDSPQRSAVMIHSLMQNLLSVMARYNGLPPEAAAGALKGMIDEALQDVQEERKYQSHKAALGLAPTVMES